MSDSLVSVSASMSLIFDWSKSSRKELSPELICVVKIRNYSNEFKLSLTDFVNNQAHEQFSQVSKSRQPYLLFLTLYFLTSASIFSIYFHLGLTRRVRLSIKASLVGDHFLYSRDLNERHLSIIVRRI